MCVSKRHRTGDLQGPMWMVEIATGRVNDIVELFEQIRCSGNEVLPGFQSTEMSGLFFG